MKNVPNGKASGKPNGSAGKASGRTARRVPRAHVPTEWTDRLQEEMTGRPADQSVEARRQQAIEAAQHSRDMEAIHQKHLPSTQSLHKELGALLRSLSNVLEQIADANSNGLPVDPKDPATAPSLLADTPHEGKPSAENWTVFHAFLNARWKPASSGFFDCCAALRDVVIDAQENLRHQYPSLAGGRPTKDGRSERVRVLARHMGDKEIAAFEGLDPDDSDLIAKARLELVYDDENEGLINLAEKWLLEKFSGDTAGMALGPDIVKEAEAITIPRKALERARSRLQK